MEDGKSEDLPREIVAKLPPGFEAVAVKIPMGCPVGSV